MFELFIEVSLEEYLTDLTPLFSLLGALELDALAINKFDNVFNILILIFQIIRMSPRKRSLFHEEGIVA